MKTLLIAGLALLYAASPILAQESEEQKLAQMGVLCAPAEEAAAAFEQQGFRALMKAASPSGNYFVLWIRPGAKEDEGILTGLVEGGKKFCIMSPLTGVQWDERGAKAVLKKFLGPVAEAPATRRHLSSTDLE
jgi:hypothetical protein